MNFVEGAAVALSVSVLVGAIPSSHSRLSIIGIISLVEKTDAASSARLRMSAAPRSVKRIASFMSMNLEMYCLPLAAC